MQQNLIDWKNIHEVILSIAIIVGGIWTLVTFRTLRSKNKAEAELAKIELEIETAKKRLFEQAIIDIQINTKQEILEDKNDYVISIVAKFTNNGNRNTNLDFSSPFFIIVSCIDFDDNGNSYQNEYICQEAYNNSTMILRAGATVEFPYFVKVKEKGLFVIELWLKLDEEERKIDNAVRGEKLDETYWTGSSYLMIN
jgi:hypothetical protein